MYGLAVMPSVATRFPPKILIKDEIGNNFHRVGNIYDVPDY